MPNGIAETLSMLTRYAYRPRVDTAELLATLLAQPLPWEATGGNSAERHFFTVETELALRLFFNAVTPVVFLLRNVNRPVIPSPLRNL